MTARSTRRAAEQAIINAAHAYIADPQGPGNYRRLIVAVEDHDRLEAGASMNTHVGRLARQCFDEIGTVYRNGGVGLTVDQLEQVMHGKHQTISARVNELRNKGWLADTGIKRPTRSGRPAIVWTPTVQALNFL